MLKFLQQNSIFNLAAIGPHVAKLSFQALAVVLHRLLPGLCLEELREGAFQAGRQQPPREHPVWGYPLLAMVKFADKLLANRVADVRNLARLC